MRELQRYFPAAQDELQTLVKTMFEEIKTKFGAKQELNTDEITTIAKYL